MPSKDGCLYEKFVTVITHVIKNEGTETITISVLCSATSAMQFALQQQILIYNRRVPVFKKKH